MGSGTKTEVINSRERAVSTDINRLQAFAASDFAQIWHEMIGKYISRSDVSPGLESSPLAGALPPFNAILNGLRCYPVNGTIDMLVTPGVMFVENATAGSDDAPILYCNDPGILAIGTLQLTAGAGAVRIDVIECQPTDTVLETDNRDIFNIGTGMFAPSMVTKVTAARLTYRIRTGVPGAGFPGAVAGWVPLAVVKVSAAAATWDDCDIWDVRRLVSEYWNAPFNESRTYSTAEYNYLTAEETNAAPNYQIKMTGKVEGKHGALRVGGDFTNYPTDAAYVDITTTTDNWAAGLVLAAGLPWYLYLCFPGDLPGWRKYCGSGSSPRVPTGPRGIPVVSQSIPGVTRKPSAVTPVPLPTSTGLSVSTIDAICVASGMVTVGGKIKGFVSDGLQTTLMERPIVAAAVSDPLGAGQSSYALVAGVSYPKFATSLKVLVELTIHGAAPPANYLPVTITPVINLLDKTGTVTTAIINPGTIASVVDGAGSTTWAFKVDLPLIPSNPTTSFTIMWIIVAAGYVYTVVSSDTVRVDGWKLATP